MLDNSLDVVNAAFDPIKFFLRPWVIKKNLVWLLESDLKLVLHRVETDELQRRSKFIQSAQVLGVLLDLLPQLVLEVGLHD